MYTNVFYFIIVFSIYSFYEARENPWLSFYEAFFCILFTYVLFFLFNKILFKRFEKIFHLNSGKISSFATLHGKQINNSTVLSIGLFAAFIFLFDVKYFLFTISGFAHSEFATNVFGILLFFGFLLIIWTCAYPSYWKHFDATATLKNYLLSHIRLNASIFTPWIIFSFFLDSINVLPDKFIAYCNNNPFMPYFLYACMLLATVCLFPWLLVRIWACRPLPEGPLRKRLDEFASHAGFNVSEMFLWNLFDGKLITAGVLGLVRKFRYLLISPALLQILDEDELESVIAHEAGHVKYHHMSFYIFFILGYAMFSYVVFKVIFYGMLSQDVVLKFFLRHDGSIEPGFYIIPIFFLITFLLLYFRFFFGFFSRNFERQSDAYAIKLVGNGTGIINSLDKIAAIGSHSRNAPNWHHFSIQERIDFLKKCDTDPREIKKHDKKVLKMVICFFAALVIAGSFFYGIDNTMLEESELHVVMKILEKKLETDPENPLLHFALGNIYYEKKLFLQAEKEYLVTLSLKPYLAEALNNLAWLYATAEDEEFRKPEEALKYSLTAARINPQPHILDTLAESYFINEYYVEAVETIKMAIRKKPGNVAYYKEQLEKFQSYLEKDMRRYKKPPDGENSIAI